MRFEDFHGPPLRVKGGIKAQNKDFARHWWSQKWLAALERLCDAGRLSRGRSYARRGQVFELHLQEGQVTAQVQGSRREPYLVRLQFQVWVQAERQVLLQQLGARISVAAQLLAGSMPEELESFLGERGKSLFPSRREVQVSCSCPDGAAVCKHIAAVYCLLTEEIDRDPWVLLGLRGVQREQWLSALGLAAQAQEEPEPLDSSSFWGTTDVPAIEFGRPPRQAASLVRMLGPFPLWRGETPFLAEMERLYAELSRRAAERAEQAAQ